MKTALKDVKTGLFLRNMDEWTSSIEEAAGFRDTVAALKFCHRNNLHGAAVIHIFREGASQKVVGFYRRGLRPSHLVDPQGMLGQQETLS